MAATRNESSHWIFDILQHVATSATPPSAIEIAERLKLPITTAHRGLHTLTQANYIAQHPMTGKYVIASSTHRLAKALLARFAIRGASLHYMRYVTGQTRDTTVLAVPLGWHALTIATVAGVNEMALTALVGSSTELHQTSVGTAILAFMGDSKIDRYLSWAKARSAKIGIIKTAVKAAQTQGYALSTAADETHGELAVPIRNIEGEALAALSIRSAGLASSAARKKILAAAVSAARRIEGLIQIEPERFRNPYGHLKPDSIVLPVVR